MSEEELKKAEEEVIRLIGGRIVTRESSPSNGEVFDIARLVKKAKIASKVVEREKERERKLNERALCT